jgi:asparagine synthase (glutamine-hydrolysing)
MNLADPADLRVIHELYWFPKDQVLKLLSDDFRAELHLADVDGAARQVLAELPHGATTLDAQLHLDERLFLPDHNLNYTDKLSMAAGVEVRVPFLDSEVVNLAHELRDRQLIRGRVSKWALREAARGVVPDAILDRPKVGFGVPVRQWVKGPLAPWIAEQLNPDTIARRGIFNPSQVQALMALNTAGKVDASYTILSMAFIERWLQFFVDKVPGAADIPQPKTVMWAHHEG